MIENKFDFFKFVNDKIRFKNSSENITNLFYTILIIVIFISIASFFYLKNQMAQVKQNWDKYKCHPAIIPFAGYIVNDPNYTSSEYTAYNFKVCLSQILSQVVKLFLAPFQAIFGGLHTFFAGMIIAIQQMRMVIWAIKNKIFALVGAILGLIASILAPARMIIAKIFDTIKRSMTGLFSLLYTLVSFIFLLFSLLTVSLRI